MAFTAREVIMTFRGQNYLSGAIRRIGADVGGLSRTAQLANQRAMLQARAQQLAYARSTAQAELFSVTTGGRALGLQRARAQLSTTEQRNVTQLRRIEEQRSGNLIRQMQTQQKINALAAAGARTKLAPAGEVANAEQIAKARGSQIIGGRGLGRVRVAESLKIEQASMERLRAEAITLNQAFKTQSQVIAGSSVRAQQLAARETELVQREAQLRQAILSRTRAIDENTLSQMRNNFEATKIAPVQVWSQRAASIEHAGRALSMFGLIGTAAMGAAASAAAKFSTQFTLAATQARRPGAGASDTARIATDVQRQVMTLMQQFPATAQEMADSFYQIFSGTNIQNVKVATSAVRVFNQMAVAGGTDLKTMTDAGITLYNNFGGLHGEFKTLTQAGNAFFAAVRYGRMNAEQFANSLPNVVAIAKQVGLSFNDIAGAMATLTRQTGGKFTTRDATGIARMIEIFARPDFQAGAKKFGVSIKDDVTGNMRPLLDIIDEFSRKTHGRARIDMLSLFKEISGAGSTSGHGGTQGTIQARRAFAFLINDIGKYRNVAGLVRGDNNELSKSFEAMSKSPGIQWQIFVNKLKVLVYEIGTNAIPAFIALGRPVEHAVRWFNSLDDHTKHLIATIGTFSAAGLLIVGVLSSMAGGVARLVSQFILMQRMKGLEKLITDARAAQAVAQTPVTATPLIINPQTGAAFSRTGQVAEEVAQRVPPPAMIIDPRTGQAFKQAAQDAGASEAGFIRAGTALKLFGLIGLTVAIPFLIQYHSQILRVVTGNTILGNSIALVGAALIAMKLGLITRLTEASAFVGPLLAGGAVILGLIAIFTNFAGSADLVRKVLDNLFNSFAGYIITVGLLVVAVYKLRDALVAMKIAEEGATVLGALSAIGPALLTRVRSITTAVSVARGAEAGVAATGAATAGTEAATVGLGAAVAGFLPALAVGGALMGGLYLWKRHLDEVHAAQKRVADMQNFLRSTLSGTDLFKSFGDAGTKLENLQRAQIAYNSAYKDLQTAQRRGVRGDELQSLALNLYDTKVALDKARASLNAFYRDGTKLSGLVNANRRIESIKNNLSDLQYVIKNYPNFGNINLFDTPKRATTGINSDDARLAAIKARLGITDMRDVQREVNLYTKALDTALNVVGDTRDKFRSRITDYINSLMQLKIIPAQARSVMSNLTAWIRTLDHVPKPEEINQYLKVVLRLQNANDVPIQFFKQIRAIERMIAAGQGSRLTHKQIDFLIKYVFKVDPRSDKAGQLRAQIESYITASVATATQNVPSLGTIFPQSPVGQLDKQVQNDTKTGNRMQALQRYWAARRAALNTAATVVDKATPKTTQVRSVQSWIDAVIKAEQAMKAHPYDVAKAQAYETVVKQLNDRFKNQPALLSAINDVLQTYTSNLDKASNAADKAAKKQQVTFEQVLSGMQNMYQQFLTQEQSAMGQLFQGPFIAQQDKFQWGGRVTAFDESHDLASQIKQFTDFHRLINSIRKRGAPAELVAQLTALGPQAIDQIRAMARMSDPEIKKYFTLFRTSQKLIHDQTMADMNQQLADYRKYGRSAALQIIAGFQSADQGLTKALTKIIRSAFGRIPTEAQIAAKEAAKNAPKAPKIPTGIGGTTTTTTTGTRTGSRTTHGLDPLKMAPWYDPSGGRFDYRRIQHLSTDQYNQAVQVSNQWVGNWKRINSIVGKFNQRDLTRQNYSDIYHSLETEIRAELRRQHLPNLTNAQLERLIRNLFGLMPARAAQVARDQSKRPTRTTPTRAAPDRAVPTRTMPRQPTLDRISVAAAFQPNLRRLSRIASEMGNLSTAHLSPRDYAKVYRDIMAEVKREIRSQGLKMPGEKGLENIIWRRLHIRPPAASDMPRRNTSSAGTTTNVTHYNITAPVTEHSTIRSQLRHADFIIRNRNKPSR